MLILNHDTDRLVGGLMNKKARRSESRGQLVFKNLIGDRFVSTEEGLANFNRIKKELKLTRFQVNIKKRK